MSRGDAVGIFDHYLLLAGLGDMYRVGDTSEDTKIPTTGVLSNQAFKISRRVPSVVYLSSATFGILLILVHSV